LNLADEVEEMGLLAQIYSILDRFDHCAWGCIATPQHFDASFIISGHDFSADCC
jgi:hypothetical protein